MLKFRLVYYIFSGALIFASVISLALFGLNLGIDFTGGALLELEVTPHSAARANDIERWLEEADEPKFGDVRVQETKDAYFIRLRSLSEQEREQTLALIENGASVAAKTAGIEAEVGVTEKRFESIGPIIGKELKEKALLQLLVAISGIILYMAWAFRNVGKVKSEKTLTWKFAIVTVVALIHDVTITTGVFALLGKFFKVEIDSSFIAAILLVLGYSVNDTIVVFDRIRENFIRHRSIQNLEVVINKSISDTMTRSLNTSLTTLLVLFSLLLFGGAPTFYFVLALTIGIGVGTYSSIFLASPLLYDWEKR
ncbi:MAG: protein translocase subunit SecF [Candidatus Jacksonbacteria bacterium]|nr:protein translocase subunit SecF [Candidatus Jacksonbacteria bacterium]